MGADDIAAAICCAVCAGVAGQSMGRNTGGYGFTHPFMHVNLTAHGIIGIIHYQSSIFGLDTEKIFPISVACAKYLSLAGLNADHYRHRHEIAPLCFLVAGAIPVLLEATGKPNEELGVAVVVVNLAAVGYTAYRIRNNWLYYTLGAGIVALLAAPAAKDIPALFPAALAAMDYCAFRLWGGDFNFNV